MADVKISALPAAPSITTADLLVIVQGGVTEKATVAQFAAAISATLPVSVAAKSTKTANYTVVAATDYLIICATNAGILITLPAAPADGNTFVVANAATAPGTNSVSGNGHPISGFSPFSLAPGQSVTCTWDAASTSWIAS